MSEVETLREARRNALNVVAELSAENERLRSLVERAFYPIACALSCPEHPWHGSDDARRWLVDESRARKGALMARRGGALTPETGPEHPGLELIPAAPVERSAPDSSRANRSGSGASARERTSTPRRDTQESLELEILQHVAHRAGEDVRVADNRDGWCRWSTQPDVWPWGWDDYRPLVRRGLLEKRETWKDVLLRLTPAGWMELGVWCL